MNSNNNTQDPGILDEMLHDALAGLPGIARDTRPGAPAALDAADDSHNTAGNADSGSRQPRDDEPVTIPPNSPTLFQSAATLRFSGAEWYSKICGKRVVIAGVGGIGSWLALLVARLKVRSLTLYDDDCVDGTNLAGQFYTRENIGHNKAFAVADNIQQFTDTESVFAVPGRFTAKMVPADIMMCGFDSMEAREMYFNSWVVHVRSLPPEQRGECLFLDGRLSIDTLQVLAVRGDDESAISRYRDKWLFPDSEAEEQVCSLKQTSYMACLVASLMTNLFVNFVAGTLDPVIPYDLPLVTQYNSQSMLFKTES